MDIIIDGSYSEAIPDTIGCGVVVMDKYGFYTERRFQIQHVAASSSFAEWYALECALNMIFAREIDTTGDKELNIYTDCQSIIDVMKNRKGMYSKNKMLHKYISKITLLHQSILFNGLYKCKFHHIKQCKSKHQIVKLHKRAHIKAQNPNRRYGQSRNKKKQSAQIISNSNHTIPKNVHLQIKLEPVARGHRKWVVYENNEPIYTGKLRTILDRYQKERHDIQTLITQKRLTVDKGTRRILKKYIGNVQV